MLAVDFLGAATKALFKHKLSGCIILVEGLLINRIPRFISGALLINRKKSLAEIPKFSPRINCETIQSEYPR